MWRMFRVTYGLWVTHGLTIEVKGFKEGRDKDLIDVEDNSTKISVALKVRYPHDGNSNASIRFELRVPRSTRYQFDRLSTASGDIRVEDITGKLKINSASGDVVVDLPKEMYKLLQPVGT